MSIRLIPVMVRTVHSDVRESRRRCGHSQGNGEASPFPCLGPAPCAVRTAACRPTKPRYLAKLPTDGSSMPDLTRKIVWSWRNTSGERRCRAPEGARVRGRAASRGNGDW
jgi:hypothetical protein